jgi:hypothetical protein
MSTNEEALSRRVRELVAATPDGEEVSVKAVRLALETEFGPLPDRKAWIRAAVWSAVEDLTARAEPPAAPARRGRQRSPELRRLWKFARDIGVRVSTGPHLTDEEHVERALAKLAAYGVADPRRRRSRAEIKALRLSVELADARDEVDTANM